MIYILYIIYIVCVCVCVCVCVLFQKSIICHIKDNTFISLPLKALIYIHALKNYQDF